MGTLKKGVRAARRVTPNGPLAPVLVDLAAFRNNKAAMSGRARLFWDGFG